MYLYYAIQEFYYGWKVQHAFSYEKKLQDVSPCKTASLALYNELFQCIFYIENALWATPKHRYVYII